MNREEGETSSPVFSVVKKSWWFFSINTGPQDATELTLPLPSLETPFFFSPSGSLSSSSWSASPINHRAQRIKWIKLSVAIVKILCNNKPFTHLFHWQIKLPRDFYYSDDQRMRVYKTIAPADSGGHVRSWVLEVWVGFIGLVLWQFYNSCMLRAGFVRCVILFFCAPPWPLEKSENVKAFSNNVPLPWHRGNLNCIQRWVCNLWMKGGDRSISEFDFSPPNLTFQTNGEPRAQVTTSVSIMNKKAFGHKELTCR